MSMRLSFSTLACPDWTMPQIIAIAVGEGYDGIELRFVQGEDSLWKLPVFSGKELASTKRALADHALTISCLDTSSRFHSPDAAERGLWITKGRRMADLAAELGAPSLRVFGNTIQRGADRASTQTWIAESVRELAEITAARGVEVWIENHGDFVSSASPKAGTVWDPANSFAAAREQPADGAARKWHPEIADPDIALPHFARWFRKNYA
jgi:sugar phosphate isomerase/epimerase